MTQKDGGGFLAFAVVGAPAPARPVLLLEDLEGTFLGEGGVMLVRPMPGGRRIARSLCGEGSKMSAPVC